MKKLLMIVFAVGAFTLASNAQSSSEKAPMSSEEKARMKAQKEQDLNNAFKQLELTEDQVSQVREVLKNADEQGKAVKSNSALNDSQKTEKKEEINKDKNAKIQVIIGDEKYKMWKEIRKKQKEANEAAAATH